MRHRLPPRRIYVTAALLLAGCLAGSDAGAWSADDVLGVATIAEVVPSPDGRRVAYVVSRADTSREPGEYRGGLFVAAADGSDGKQITFDDVSVSAPAWSPDGKRIAYLSRAPGTAAAALAETDAGGGAAYTLVEAAAGIEAFRWSPAGQRLAVLRADPPPSGSEIARVDAAATTHHHLWRLDLDREGAAKPLERLTDGDFNVGHPLLGAPFDWSPDGREIVFTRTRSADLDAWRSADIAVVDLDRRIRALQQTDAAEFAPHYSPDGRQIAFTVSVFPPSWIRQSRVAVMRREGTGVRVLAGTPDQQPNLIGWAGNRRVLVEEPDETRTALWSLPVNGGAPRRLDDGRTVLSTPAVNARGSRLGFAVASAAEAPEAALTPVRRFRPVIVSRANLTAPELPRVETRVVRWQSADGVEIEGLLTLPPGHRDGQRHALLLVVHGGPAGVFRDDYLGDPDGPPLAALAARGYALLRANPRGSSGYGYDFRAAVRGDWGGADYDDLMHGVDHAIALGVADPERLGVLGWSYGGFMSAWIITRSHRFGAAVIGAPITDLAHMDVTTDIPGFVADYLGGDFWDLPELYAERSPLLQAGAVTTPALVLHGGADTRVPSDQGVAFYRALERRGIDTRLVLFPRAGHRLLEPRQIADAARETLAWFEAHVPVH